MTPAEIHQRLTERFGDRVIAAGLETLDPWIQVCSEAVWEIARFLKSDPDFAFDYLNDLTVVDFLEVDPKKAPKAGFDPHLEVVYHLFSFTHRHKIVLKAPLPRWKDGVTGSLPEIASVSDIWAIADWHEREAFDMFGIIFTGHPNLRRILCSEDWVGHPLRKDYEFPLEYHGIRGK